MDLIRIALLLAAFLLLRQLHTNDGIARGLDQHGNPALVFKSPGILCFISGTAHSSPHRTRFVHRVVAEQIVSFAYDRPAHRA